MLVDVRLHFSPMIWVPSVRDYNTISDFFLASSVALWFAVQCFSRNAWEAISSILVLSFVHRNCLPADTSSGSCQTSRVAQVLVWSFWGFCLMFQCSVPRTSCDRGWCCIPLGKWDNISTQQMLQYWSQGLKSRSVIDADTTFHDECFRYT